jgi:hypothetical protein
MNPEEEQSPELESPVADEVQSSEQQPVPDSRPVQDSRPSPANDPKQFSPRRRLQELLAIPDSLRTDAQWDELIELEIQTAPGNRASSPDQSMRQNPNPSTGRPPRSHSAHGAPRPAGPPGPQGTPGGQGKKPFKKFRKGPRT